MVHFGDKARRIGPAAAGVIGGALVLAALAVIVLPLLVPAADLRRAATAALAGSTGQTVHLQGEPSFRFFPSPRVVLGKVSVPLPSGQALDAENVMARLNLWHLMWGRVDIADVIVERPTLVLRTGGSPALALAPLLAAANRPALKILDGTIVWRSDEGLTRELVSGIVARLDRTQGGRGMMLTVALDWRDAPVSGTLALDDSAALLSGVQTPARLVVSTDGASARFDGRVALGPDPALDGDVSAQADSLRDVLGWMGVRVPSRGGFGPFALTSRLGARDAEISLTETSAELDGNRADGGLLITAAQGRPLAQGTFASDRLNLTPYGAIRLTTDDGRGWDRTPLDVSLLKAFDLDLRISAAQVLADQTRFSTVAASAVLHDGRLVLALGEARAWGGLLTASLSLAPQAGGSGAEVRLEAEATDVDVYRCLDEISGLRRVEGTGTLQVDVSGAGRSVLDIARNLSGTTALTAENGYLLGLDVAQLLHRVERRPLSAGNDLRGGRTGFTDLSARLLITRGEGKVEEMRLEGRQVRLAMDGSLSIAARDMDMAGRAALILPAKAGDKSAEKAGDPPAAGIDLPFSVRGPWDNPQIFADPLSLIERSGAAQPLIESVRSRSGAAARPAN